MTQRYLFAFILTASALFLASCGISSRVVEPSEQPRETGERPEPSAFDAVIERGVASWYGPNFHGKQTANGEIYDMNALTAAHRTLPFNTFVQVVNTDNEKTVIVRINDRGPFKDNRIIDLSKKAASRIDMIGPGTANVRLFLAEGDPGQFRDKDLSVSTYTVQLGSYESMRSAEEAAEKINGARIEKFILNDGREVYRIFFGIYTDKNKAERDQRRLKRKGFNGYVKQLENS